MYLVEKSTNVSFSLQGLIQISAESQLEEARNQLKENSSEDAIAYKIELDSTRQELNSALANVEALKTDKLESDDALSRFDFTQINAASNKFLRLKYELESAHSEASRLRDEHAELTQERRKLVDEGEKLRLQLSEKNVESGKFEAALANREKHLASSLEENERLSTENQTFKEKFDVQDAVNARLKEGNLKLQDAHQKMSNEHKNMSSRYEEMLAENELCRQQAQDAKNTAAEIYKENQRLTSEAEKIEGQLTSNSNELANYRDLLEKALGIRKDLELKLSVFETENRRGKI
jgi:chromosome segregation ATPase